MSNFNQLANDKAAHAKAVKDALLTHAGATPIGPQTAAAYTAQQSDAGTYLRFTSAAAVTFTVPSNANEPLAVGTEIELEQAGAGIVTVAAAPGVTINSRGGALATSGQFAVAALKKVAEDVWTLTGDIA